ncbi:hypothetical protein ACFQ4M_07385 [Thauera mechernichensis]|uniref:Transposase n=1 Tax=Thauera mechernichensis TaxID=82788 RepID=A0ABW3WE88_9RHOO|nr:hypothetical protein [Thauera mechernichensis]MDG3065351.1 hypothetical protein [Thauera mechernichensis]
MTRHFGRPSPRTLRRWIAAEKKRLLAAGVDVFELHAVCQLLRCAEHSPAWNRALQFLEERG